MRPVVSPAAMPLLYIAVTVLIVMLASWIVNTRQTMFGEARTVVNVCLSLILIGMLLWLVNMYVPMAGSIKTILNIVVVIATLIGVLRAFGLWSRTILMWHDMKHRARHAADHAEKTS